MLFVSLFVKNLSTINEMGRPQLSTDIMIRWQIIGMREVRMSLRQIADAWATTIQPSAELL